MAIEELSVAIVGADYPNKDGGNRRTEIAFCDRGEPLELRPEPKSPHDEHAVAVFSARQFQIGYVASARAVFLKRLLKDGHELFAVFQDVAPWGAVARIGVDRDPGNLPEPGTYSRTLVQDEVDQTPAVDYWPDDEPNYD